MIESDVVVIGAGPAGSTASALLARAGHGVVLLEKEQVPRFHIGESLLPCDLPIFERLGFEPTRDGFVYKAGAEFVDERTGDHTTFFFSDGLPGTPSHAWQVERARFDAELLDIARRDGADVRTGERATEIEALPDRVDVRTERDTYRARYLFDATGQDAFLARRRRTVEPIRGFGLAAVFCHFRGLRPDVIEELEELGNIKILIHEHGWAWVIPLRGGMLSFGVVTREQGVDASVLDRVLEASPLVQRLTKGAEQAPSRVIRNFSYRNREPYGPRWACIGDAACFLDPVFSSGVSLAMLGAERSADLLSATLGRGDEAAPDLMSPVSAHMDRAYTTFSALIHSFYHTRIIEHLFFHRDPDPQIRAGLISVLAGDVWRDDNDFQRMLLGGRRARAQSSWNDSVSTDKE